MDPWSDGDFLHFMTKAWVGGGESRRSRWRGGEKRRKRNHIPSQALHCSSLKWISWLIYLDFWVKCCHHRHCFASIAPLWNWGQNMSWNEKYPPTFTSCSCKGTTIKFTREIHSRELFVKLNSVTVPRHAKWKTSKRRKRRKVQLHPAPRGLLWRIVDLLLRSMTALCLRRPRLPWAYPCALIWRVGKISKNDRPRHVLMCVKEHCNSCCL